MSLPLSVINIGTQSSSIPAESTRTAFKKTNDNFSLINQALRRVHQDDLTIFLAPGSYPINNGLTDSAPFGVEQLNDFLKENDFSKVALKISLLAGTYTGQIALRNISCKSLTITHAVGVDPEDIELSSDYDPIIVVERVSGIINLEKLKFISAPNSAASSIPSMRAVTNKIRSYVRAIGSAVVVQNCTFGGQPVSVGETCHIYASNESSIFYAKAVNILDGEQAHLIATDNSLITSDVRTGQTPTFNLNGSYSNLFVLRSNSSIEFFSGILVTGTAGGILLLHEASCKYSGLSPFTGIISEVETAAWDLGKATAIPPESLLATDNRIATTAWVAAVLTDRINNLEALINSITEGTGTPLPIVPPGAMVYWSSDTPPAGWLLCAGQEISRTTYSNLFAVIGTQFGTGDGLTTFNLPNTQGRAALGVNPASGSNRNPNVAAYELGDKGGSETIRLTVAQCPTHTHSITIEPHDHPIADRGHYHAIDDPGHTHSMTVYSQETRNISALGGGAQSELSASLVTNSNRDYTGINRTEETNANLSIGRTQLSATINSTGEGGRINILPPFIALFMIIKY